MSSAPVSRALALGELVEGLRACVEFSVTAAQMQQFAELSGDFNPLHTDDAFARTKGFDGVVVYGALEWRAQRRAHRTALAPACTNQASVFDSAA